LHRHNAPLKSLFPQLGEQELQKETFSLHGKDCFLGEQFAKVIFSRRGRRKETRRGHHGFDIGGASSEK